MGLRTATSFAVLLAATAASAQPADPYAPAPTPQMPAVPSGQDPVLAEQIAESLVSRAQELLDAKVYLDAKQLAVEALVKSPKGPSAERAKLVIKQVNQILGITDAAQPTDLPPPDLTPIEDPTKPKAPVEAAPIVEGVPKGDANIAASVHGALYGGILGAAIGSFFSSHHPAAGAVPTGLGLGAVGALVSPFITRKLALDEAQVRTVGSGVIWGGTIGGMFAGTVQGANGGTVSASGVLVGSAIGATLGGLGGAGFASNHKLTRGDVALVDTLAGIGTMGGLTLGMLMQPAQREAYSLNAALGAAAGVAAGVIAAPEINTTPRRMLRVAGLAAAGGATPFLLYAAIHDPSSKADERVTGALSTLGLVGGAWLGFYLTRDMDEGLDIQDLPKAKHDDDTPPAVVGRASSGDWKLGMPAIAPLSLALAPQPGMTVSLVGGAF